MLRTESIRALLNEICDLLTDNLELIEETRYEIKIKPDGTPVTNSDVLIERLVREHISKVIPDAVFIGEESYDSSSVDLKGYLVLLDPIDGTENFCSGLKEWGISFGLWQGENHLGSLLFLPEMGIKLMTGDEIHPVRSRIIGVSSSMSDTLINSLREPGEFRIMGCAVYNLYNVIRGSFRRFKNPKGAYIWDILPGVMLALEHGCQVMINDEVFSGKFLDPRELYRVDITR